ncbi:hypothetical protein J6590_055552 [Homalodisca vitripennis]|nr:hypothetical protein J6590_055552 [Homalodisca vitripennis]
MVHVMKRMGTRLRNMKSKMGKRHISDGKSIKGAEDYRTERNKRVITTKNRGTNGLSFDLLTLKSEEFFLGSGGVIAQTETYERTVL